MNLSVPIALFPCHAIEDFPSHLRGDDAAQVLAAWTVLWHPALIHLSGQIPAWQTTDFLSQSLENKVLIAPKMCESRICADIRQLVDRGDTTLIFGDGSRDSYLSHPKFQIYLDNAPVGSAWPEHFFALGYAFLQIRLVTQQLRYSNALDLDQFRDRLVAAARTAIESESAPPDQIRDALQPCFDLLLEEKSRYYPMPAQLLDIVLPRKSDTPDDVLDSGADSVPCNLLAPAQRLEHWHASAPPSFTKLVEQIDRQQFDLIGGVWAEAPQSFLPMASYARQLSHGLDVAHRLLSRTPQLFARRTFGLHPAVPTLLGHVGIPVALHASMGGGETPTSGSPILNWQGMDGTSCLAIGSRPLNSLDAGTLLSLSITLGQMMDSAHHAVQPLIRWSGDRCEFLQDLFLASRYGPILGEWMTASQAVDLLYDPGFTETYVLDEYRNTWLSDAAKYRWPDPISRWVNYYRNYHQLETSARASSIANAIRPAKQASKNESETHLQVDDSGEPIDPDELLDTDEMLLQLDATIGASDHESLETSLARISAAVTASADRSCTAIADALRLAVDSSDTAGRICIFNPLSFRRRVHLQLPGRWPSRLQSSPFVMADSWSTETTLLKSSEASSADSTSPPSSSSDSSDMTDVVVELPSTGFCMLDLTESQPSSHAGRKQPDMVEGHRIRNEFFEIEVDEATGGIARILSFKSRKSVGAQRLAWRFPDPGQQGRAGYGRMVARRIAIVRRSGLCTEVESEGVLATDNDKTVAAFRQIVRVVRGLRTLQFDITIEPEKDVDGHAWTHYFCSRLAWPDPDALIWRESLGQLHPTFEQQLDAPTLVDIRLDDSRLSLLPRGLPFHRRSDRRMLDTLLMVSNESARRFRFALAVDSPQPTLSSLADATEPIVFRYQETDRKLPDGWLLHLNQKNLLIAEMRTLRDDANPNRGLELLVQETSGRSGQAQLSIALPVESAYVINGRRELQSNLAVDDRGSVRFDYNPFGILRIVLNLRS